MANAIKKISVQRGYDVTRYVLNCFGGAGGQHACLVADALGMKTVLIHPLSSLLSAYGMGLADIRSVRQQAIEEELGEGALATIRRIGGGLADNARREVADQGVATDKIKVFVRAHIRYAGTDTALVVDAFELGGATASPPPLATELGFIRVRSSKTRPKSETSAFGWRDGEGASATTGASSPPPPTLPRKRGREQAAARGDSVALDERDDHAEQNEARLRARAQGTLRFCRPQQGARRRGGVGGGGRRRRKIQRADAQATARRKTPLPRLRTSFFSQGQWHRAIVFTREQLAPGHRVAGPAIIVEPHQTVVVERGWRAEISARNHLLLRRVVPLRRRHAVGTRADPVMLEVFNNLFMSIAEQMGLALQNTAYSVNIKERLDFSCAVFDGTGSLIANAPHMPVHLGSMDRAVETVIRENKGKIHPGDVYAINAPYNGGTHLPDITVCTPVFDHRKKSILFWVASRGHHADIGGISPGSMSPDATTIEEEGVYIDNFKLVDRGRFREAELYALLTEAKFPARNPVQNVNDLKAQIAANAKGAYELPGWSSIFPYRWSKPTCATCRTTPPKACAASSTACTTVRSTTRWTRARGSP